MTRLVFSSLPLLTTMTGLVATLLGINLGIAFATLGLLLISTKQTSKLKLKDKTIIKKE